MSVRLDAMSGTSRTEGGGQRFGEPLCKGDPALPALLEPWMSALARDPTRAHGLLGRFGSPVHIHSTDPFLRNAEAMADTAKSVGLDFGLFFARKANKALAYVHAAKAAGFGVDVASAEELTESLSSGIAPERIVLSAAVKPAGVLHLAAESGATVVLDNIDEAERLGAATRDRERSVKVALRLTGFDGRNPSRFGFHVDRLAGLPGMFLAEGSTLDLVGLHFHLDGYDGNERVQALNRAIEEADRLRAAGLQIRFIDMGGGFPVSYLEGAADWNRFRGELDRALSGRRDPITWHNHGFGRILHKGELAGSAAVYPHHQSPVGDAWLQQILLGPFSQGGTIASALNDRGLRLHAEPGRALLQGCGATLARVEHRKRMSDGTTLIGLAMNGSNCRTRKSELLVDPILIPPPGASSLPRIRGVLTGSYCSEDDTIMSRLLDFPRGVRVGDAILFPNTAGYYMHFVESRSHQFPLPLNVVLGDDDACRLDDVDRPAGGIEDAP